MKEIFDYDNKFENDDAINGIKYYYFGKTFSIMDSKHSFKKKLSDLNLLLDEVNEDDLLKNKALLSVKNSITDIIYGKIEKISFEIEVKKFKLPLKFFRINLFNNRSSK